MSVLNDDTRRNAAHLGAVQEMQLAISHVHCTVTYATLVVVIGADILIRGLDFEKGLVVPFLPRTSTHSLLGVVYYRLADMRLIVLDALYSQTVMKKMKFS